MLYKDIEKKIQDHKEYAFRRKNRVPALKRVWVLTCMDDRIPVHEALNVEEDDVQVFRNAGAVVTDDVIRSAAIATNFLGIEEIVVITHTDCGMILSKATDMVKSLQDKGHDFTKINLDPALPELTLREDKICDWLKTFENVDEACVTQVKLLQDHPLIPEAVKVTGYVWEVGNRRLRKPFEPLLEK